MKVSRNLNLTVFLPLTSCVLLATHVMAAPQQDTPPAPANGQPPEAGLSPDQLRNQAVQRARLGDYQPAIDALERILASDPDNVAAYHDFLIILGWAEQDQKALLMADRVDSASAPVTVINSLGKSARNVGDFAQAIDWYTLAVTRAPANLESNLGRALALADQGRYVQAIVTFDQILASDAENRGALRGKVVALQRLLLPAEALAIAAAHPGLLSNDELARLQTDWAAVQIRWANNTATPELNANRSLESAFDSMTSTAEQYSDNDLVQQRIRFDRIAAYSSQQEMAAAVAEYEQLNAAPPEIPPYVLAAAASAYLHLRQPDKAEALLLQALHEEPDNFLLLQDMFWVHVDLERPQEALVLAEEMRRSQPMWLEEPGSTIVRGNPRRLQAEIMVGLAYSFADQLPQAQARFEQLLAAAPYNTDLQHELATVLRRRGWPERALFEYQQVLSIEPDLVAAGVGDAHTLLDRRQFELGESRINTLVAETPKRADVSQLNRRWEQINQYQFQIDTSFGNSTGDQFGSEQYNIDGKLFMKPLAYRFRPFVHSTDAFAEFPEGDASRKRLGAGVEYRSVDWIGSLELHVDREGGGDLGVSGTTEWFIDDYWSVAGKLETESAAVPLRGHRTGLSADQVGLSAEYRWSELRNVSVSAEQTRISDGNTRHSWSVRGRQRMLTRPAYKLDLDAGIYISSSDTQNVVYFNPSRDAALLVTAINDWRTYRRYDFAFTQQFNVEFGFYQQKSHSTNPIGSLQYLGNIDFNAGFNMHFGLQYGRRVYDGDAENATFFTLGVAGSF